MKKSTRLLAGFALSLVSAAVLAADTGGEIKGHVAASSGMEISNATVIVKHKTKGVTRTIQTNSVGNYVLRNLPVGDYVMTISRDGYDSQESSFRITVGDPTIVDTTLGMSSNENRIQIVGSVIKGLNMAETTAGRSFDFEELKVMPVESGFESMVLMTAGTVENGAPADFEGASSIGGGSSAENGYYLNGINITQIESGLGSFRMPWEAIQQTNVQTSGVTAEFGGALGGIINAVSKSGDNEFKFGAELRYDPEFGYSAHDSVRSVANPGSFVGKSTTNVMNNERDEQEFQEYSIWASGPIVEDKAFFYVLFNPNKENDEWATNSLWHQRERTSDRWFVNADWFITENHSVGFTAFNTKREWTTLSKPYTSATDTINPLVGEDGLSYGEDGGDFIGLSYHGEFGDMFSLDVVYGRTEEEEIPLPANFRPLVKDCISGTCVQYSTNSDNTIEPNNFKRDQFRIDFRIDLAAHEISVGIDRYDIDVYTDSYPNGVAIGDRNDAHTDSAIGSWDVGIAGTGDIGNTAVRDGLANGTQFVRRRVRNRFTDSTVTSTALYAQDSWTISNEFTLNYGARLVSFENTLSPVVEAGETEGLAYIDMDNNFAPRLAGIWDIGGTGEHKVFVSLGRYFQPVASRMNFTQGSSAFEYFDYYENTTPGTAPALRADGSPERGNSVIPRFFREKGVVSPFIKASKNLKAMYSDQFSVGYSTELSGYEVSVRGTYNKLGRSVEDTEYWTIIEPKLAAMGVDNNTGVKSFYMLANPGSPVEIEFDFDGDGTEEKITLSEADVQLAKPERQYLAWDFEVQGSVTDDFQMYAAYTWSHSWGNTEGLVKTTNGQADPGWTSDYDYGDALDHAYGNLPNDRRHSIKFSGIYDLTESMALGFAYRGASGRPLNEFWDHPEGVDSCRAGTPWAACNSRGYTGGFYDKDGNPTPRGSAGNLPWSHNFDLSFSYRNDDILEGLLLKATVYNIFENDSAIDVKEVGNSADFGMTETYQKPRYLSLTARVEF